MEGSCKRPRALGPEPSTGAATGLAEIRERLSRLEQTGSEQLRRMQARCATLEDSLESLAGKFSRGGEEVTGLAQAQADAARRLAAAEACRRSGPMPAAVLSVRSLIRSRPLDAKVAESARLARSSQHTVDELCSDLRGVKEQQAGFAKSVPADVQSALAAMESSIAKVGESGRMQLQRLDDAMSDLQARVAECERSVLEDVGDIKSLGSAVREVQASLADVEQARGPRTSSGAAAVDTERMKVVEKALEDKVDAEELEELLESLAQLQRDVRELREVPPAMPAATGAVASLQAQLGSLVRELDGKASADDLQALREAVRHGESALGSLPDAACLARQEKCFREEIAAITLRCSQLEDAVVQKADCKELQALKDGMAGLQSRDSSAEKNRFQQLESAIAGMRREVTTVERALKGKADIDQLPVLGGMGAGAREDVNIQTQLQLQQLKSSVGILERKGADFDQALQERACQGQLQSCKRAVSGVENRLTLVEQSLQDKAEAAHLQQLRTSLAAAQAQVAAAEQGLAEKIGAEDLQETKTSVAALRTQLAASDRAAHEKASLSQLHQLKATVMGIETKVAGMEQSLQDKASVAQLQRVKELAGHLQAKVSQTQAQDRSRNSGAGRLQRLSYHSAPACDEMGARASGLGLEQWPRLQAPRPSLNDGNAAGPAAAASA